jgi:mRNA-degrading endonuclease RelE of RelBE toxin-antitoxin system
MFEVRVSEDAEGHLKEFSARDQRILLRAIEEQLTHEPTVATRNRKQLRANPLKSCGHDAALQGARRGGGRVTRSN